MTLLKTRILPLISIILAEYGIIELFEYIVGQETFFLNKVSSGVRAYIIVSIGFILYCLYILLISYKALQIAKSKTLIAVNSKGAKDTTDFLAAILKNAYSEKRWAEVIKIGSALSQPLWYTGKFKYRINVGELVASAAAFESNKELQAETLIDDLGWTNFRLKQEGEAIRNIKLGLSIAEAIKNNYLISKAYRHLADISLTKNNLNECFGFLKKSYSAFRNIQDPLKKTEMHGNLLYAVSKYHWLGKKNNKKGFFIANKSISKYMEIQDLDRAVKIYNLKGKILLDLGREEDAISSFQEGLTLANKISNIVNIVSNSSSLAEYYYKHRRYDFAKKMIEIARENSQAMDDPFLIEKISNQAILVESKLSQP